MMTERIFIFTTKSDDETYVVLWEVHPPKRGPQKSFMKTTGITFSGCVLLRNARYSDSNQTKGAALSDKSSGPYMSVPTPQVLVYK